LEIQQRKSRLPLSEQIEAFDAALRQQDLVAQTGQDRVQLVSETLLASHYQDSRHITSTRNGVVICPYIYSKMSAN